MPTGWTTRRAFVAQLAFLALSPLRARAQAGGVRRVGFIYPGPFPAAPPRISAFLEGLGEAGFRAPEAIELIPRIADGDNARLAPFAAELVQARADAIVAVSTPAAKAVQAATSTIPILAHDLETDPVASGLVASLARPGGNLTGLFFDFPDFRTKLLQLVREMLPRASRIAVLQDPAAGEYQARGLAAAARALGLDLDIVEVGSSAEIDGSVARAKHRDAEALVMLSSPMFGANARRIAELTAMHRLPAISLFPDFARAGGLLAYGPNVLETYRRLGGMAAKVLRGSKPSELPVELPSRFELVVNLRTAKLLGIEIPPSILLRADELAE